MKIITIQNGKGGIGKTTTAWALATGLPRKYPEYKALAIDFEPSGNLTYLMDGDFINSPTMYHVFNGDVDIRAAIQHTSQGHVIAGNSSLTKIDKLFSGADYLKGISAMKRELEKLAGEYTHIFIDNVPLVGSIQTLQSTTSAHDLVIPMHADALTLQGLANLREGLLDIRQLNPNLNIAGILLVKHHQTVNERKYSDVIREWAGEMGTKVFNTHIREAIDLQTVQGNRENLYAATPDANPTMDYLAFIDEYLGKGYYYGQS